MPAADNNLRNPAAVARFVMAAVIGLGLDLWTKSLAFQKLAAGVFVDEHGVAHVIPRAAFRVIPGWLEFEVTANQGAVFGLGQGWRPLFIAVSIGAILFLSYLFSISGKQRWYQIVLGMLLAGVLGNMYDRIFYDYVRDMIHALPRWPHLFPWIFNVADSLLCVGVALLVLHSIFFAGKAGSSEHAPSEEARS